MFADPLIARVELPDLDQDQHGDVDANSVTEFDESSEIELKDHRDVEYESQVNVSPVRDDRPAFRTQATVQLGNWDAYCIGWL